LLFLTGIARDVVGATVHDDRNEGHGVRLPRPYADVR
jgi:hypothetical protein